MTIAQLARMGSVTALVLLTAFIVFLSGNQRLALAAELPFDHPASGSEILCYLNGTDEIDGVTIHPPLPTFEGMGECDGSGGSQPPPSPPPPPPSEEEPNDGDEGEPTPLPACSNGIDDDADSLTDMADPGCSDSSDNDEANSSSEEGPSTGSGSSSGGGGGGGGRGGSTSESTSTPAGIVLGFSTTTESCDLYLTAFIREGADNDVDQVKRLQRFLHDFEGAEVAETGVYDKATLAAVHALQSKYAADILAPWGTSESTGYVYLTTRKKVNEIFCRYTKTFFLTVDELNKIEVARAVALEAPAAAPATPKFQVPKPAPSVATSSQAGAAATQGASLGNVLDFLRGMLDRVRAFRF